MVVPHDEIKKKACADTVKSGHMSIKLDNNIVGGKGNESREQSSELNRHIKLDPVTYTQSTPFDPETSSFNQGERLCIHTPLAD